MASSDQSTTPPVSRYAAERLEALYERVTELEVAVVNAATCLENKNADGAVTTLTTALVETFRGGLLCSSETTDAMLDEWLPECDKTDAALADSEGQG